MRDRTHTYLWLRDDRAYGYFLTMDTGSVTVAKVPLEILTEKVGKKMVETRRYEVFADKETSWELIPYDYNPLQAFKKYHDSELARSEEAETEMLAVLSLDPTIKAVRKMTAATVISTAPEKARSKSSKEPKAPKTAGGYSLGQLCAEIKMDPSEARKILRTAKIEKPGGKWEWPNAEAAMHIRMALGKK
jgi:hypothetical protein